MVVVWKHRLRTSGTVTVLSRRFDVGADGLLSPQPSELPDGEREAVTRVLEAVPSNYAPIKSSAEPEQGSPEAPAGAPAPRPPARVAPRPAGRPGTASRP
jgi:hypothetical protein